MSFSMDIKDEVTRLDSTKTELISELSAIVRNSASIDNGIKINIQLVLVVSSNMNLFPL